MTIGATDFGMLNNERLTRWSLDFWRAWRDTSGLMNSGFVGTSNGSMIQRIKELSKTTDGARAVITLVRDPVGDGVVGDNQLESNEELMRAANQVIQLDQMRNAHLSVGEMAEQASIVNFRREARDSLAFWLADRFDQLAFLTLSGVAYSKYNNGATRVGSQFPLLKFAADVTAPSTRRYARWDATDGLITYLNGPPSNTDLVAADTPSWQMLVDMKAYAVDNQIRPMRFSNGVLGYNVFMTGAGIAKLKKDQDFLEILKHAEKRGEGNPLFKGTPRGAESAFFIDGMNIMEFKHVYNTRGAASGSKWGATGTVDGQRVLLCGAQALGFADIGRPKWVEKEFDYDNRQGIAIGKILGFKKPVFPDQVSGSLEDFGVLAVDTAI